MFRYNLFHYLRVLQVHWAELTLFWKCDEMGLADVVDGIRQTCHPGTDYGCEILESRFQCVFVSPVFLGR